MIDWNRPIRSFFDSSQLLFSGNALDARWGWMARMIRPREFPQTRASLIASMRDGAAAPGWREFFHYYAPAVFRVALFRGLRGDEADDIVQQVMISVAKRIGDFEYNHDRGRFRGWVRSIAENKIRDYRRKCARDAHASHIKAVQDAAVDVDTEVWEKQWRLQDLSLCLEELATDVPLRHLEAFRLYVIEGRPPEDVANELELSIGHVYVIRTRIIQRIRRRMTELDIAGEC